MLHSLEKMSLEIILSRLESKLSPPDLTCTSVNLVQITLVVDFLPALPLLPDQPREDCNVCTEKGKTLKPDKQECVVSLEFQQIGRQKPRSLKVQYFRKSGEILI